MRSILAIAGIVLLSSPATAEPWKRHTIDAASRGADGVRLADANGDGLPDVATGWEEGGVIRVCLNPGPAKAARPWPAVTVGKVRSPEDAVLVDLDGDGILDVVSCCEGRTRSVFMHWAPTDSPFEYLEPDAWRTEAIPAVEGMQMWMFALPMQIDGRGGIDLIVGSKGPGASIGWLQSPEDPRDAAGWKFHRLYDAGWIMSLLAIDVDEDGDDDVLASDRYGEKRGVLWLENPGAEAAARGRRWNEHRIGANGRHVLFLTAADLDRDGLRDVLTTTREGVVIYLHRTRRRPAAWQEYEFRNPFGVSNGKAVRVADVDLDGRPDIVHTANTGGDRTKPGVAWMNYRRSPTDPDWQPHDVSGPEGIKFDLIEPADLDADGDLDLIACEETDNLGVFWYENPTR
jgi:hypothetical protein